MRAIFLFSLLVALSAGAWMLGEPVGLADDDEKNVAMLDNCDPSDDGWTPTGGCTLKPRKGDVSLGEFLELLATPLDLTGTILIGHPSWRNDPSYLTVDEDERVRVKNRGGRAHTFTEVEHFGGGFVPPLNRGLETAPECVDPTAPPTVVAPGGRITLQGLAPGLHKFQCCIHPWMRAAIRVGEE